MPRRIDSFRLEAGQLLGDKYRVVGLLGSGWEGEVYRVVEKATGIDRAAKVFYPQRNPGNRTLKFYARKLHKLSDCDILIQYHTLEAFEFRGATIQFMVSDYAPGILLSDYLDSIPGKRLTPFEAIHLLYAVAVGVEQIHSRGEYHGDLHSGNVIVQRRGLGFAIKLIDLYHWPDSKTILRHSDICDLVRLFYDCLGGAKHYARQPAMVKYICCGLKKTLILRKFKTVSQLRKHLETMEW